MKRFVTALILVGVLTLSLAGTALAGGPMAGDGNPHAPYGHGPGTQTYMYNPGAGPHDNTPVYPRPQCETPEQGDRWADAYDGSPCGHCVSGDSYGCVIWRWDGCDGVQPPANYKGDGCGQPQAGCDRGYVQSQDGRTVGWADNGCSTDCWTTDGWSTDQWSGDSWTTGDWSTDQWSDDSWTTGDWSTDQWSGDSWTTDGWSTDQWSGDSWTTGDWSTDQWSGDSWTTGDWSTDQWSGDGRTTGDWSTDGQPVWQPWMDGRRSQR